MVSTPEKCGSCGSVNVTNVAPGHCIACLLQMGLAPDLDYYEPLASGDRVGNYLLQEELGEGGCGIVFLAAQSEPVQREVALKIIKPGMDTRAVIARFEAERQMLAWLDHPHIAKIFDAGTTESGRPYFVMELVRGIPITEYCDQQKLSISDRLKLFTIVCRAVQHAHQKGVIHRDLKPSNILVTHDEAQGRGVPRIIDFGIAKSTTVNLNTTTATGHSILGTPAYMSPEQASRGEQDIDTRADIYSLGALLFELLTGLTPFDSAELKGCNWDEVPRFIREVMPARPSARLKELPITKRTAFARQRQTESAALPAQLQRELDWVVMKCLQKDRALRYETAHALAMEIERYLNHEPILALPPSALYQLQKVIARNRIAFAAAAIVLITLLAGLGFTTWSLARERAAHRRALAEAGKTREVAALLMNMLKGAHASATSGRDNQLLREIVERTLARASQDLSDQPDVAAELHNALAEVCGELGLYPQMEEVARRALRLSQALSRNNLEAAYALEQISAALMHEGRLDEAENAARESLAMRRMLVKQQSPEIAAALNNLGLILRERGVASAAKSNSVLFVEAEKLFREAVDIDEKQSGSKSSDTTIKFSNIASTLWSEGKFAEAEAMYRDILKSRRKAQDNNPPGVALALNNLATVLLSEQKLAEAELAAREALALDQKFLGSRHPDRINALETLADILAAEGNFAEAESLDREALAQNPTP